MVDNIFVLTTALISSVVLLSLLITAWQYPYDTDSTSESGQAAARDYYRDAYEVSELALNDGKFLEKEEYVQKARAHATKAGIPRLIEEFVETHGLRHGRALEIGAGSGLLQDAVDRYVAMDVSARASRFFHKPFVEGSATAIPFADETFDAAWSIWVLEHISNPEQALSEIRRVMKDGSYLLLKPAWNCDSWAAEGYEVRPYSDFSLKGKLIKASIPVRLSKWYELMHSRQVRILRTLFTKLSGKPSQFHFTRLTPNYARYWVTDSDAVVSLDFFEMYLWFTSRGDTPVNTPSLRQMLFGLPGRRPLELIVRINKPRATN